MTSKPPQTSAGTVNVPRLVAVLAVALASTSLSPTLNSAPAAPETASKASEPIIETTAPEHWAFRPPKRITPPATFNGDWPKTPIDQFVLAKLEANKLQPSPRAGKRTLIRRATFDLTGLPPAVDEIDEFLRDDSPEAFARVVDRLLASPSYGERWARYWLDVARYADTKGYVYSDREEPRFVHSYAYRDWVVRAFNEDLPYDRFLMLQIAADQLTDSDSQDDLAAMGFLTLGRRFLGVVHDIIDDRIDVVMRGTQGLTVGCARCHDHKFDPIPIQDYYALYGIFAGSTEQMLPLRDNKTTTAESFDRGLHERRDKFNQSLKAKRNEFSNRFRTKAAEYLVAVLDAKKLPTEEHYEIRGPDDLNPTIVRAWENYLLRKSESFDPVFAPWHALAALPDAEFAARAPAVLQDFRSESGRANSAVLDALAKSPLTSMRDVAQRYGQLLAEVHLEWQKRISEGQFVSGASTARLEDSDREQLRQVLYGPDSPVQIPVVAAADLEWYFDEKTRVELMKLHAEIERWIIRSSNAPPYAVILKDRLTQQNARVFIRGNPANKGEEVPRRFLTALSPENCDSFDIGSGRLELARAIASPNNPLTARVMVNRVWLHHFGAGLVDTPSDFGTRSDGASHPELLDWLANYFIEQNWSLKSLHRSIMLSNAYQQSSNPPVDQTSNASRVDPENRLLWRMNRYRLDFEALRDSMLTVSGELTSRLGGPPLEPSSEPAAKRRTIYSFVDRQFLPPVFRVFDFANPDLHTPHRPETTVPQQALFFMNSPFVIERARALMRRPEIRGLADPQQRIDRMYRIVFQRLPSPNELDIGLNFIRAAELEPVDRPPPPPPSSWFYGYGHFGADSQRVASFQQLPHFTGDAWQGGPQWPDPKLGWVRLTADGGHTGNDLQHAAIRRWVAPRNGTVTIAAALRHDHEAGDGVHALIVSSRHGVLGEWIVHKSKTETNVDRVDVESGDTLDFVADINANLNSDDFHWAPVIRFHGSNESGVEERREWNAKKNFGGPAESPPIPVNAWEKFAQVLLLSNEFMFVD